MPEQTFQLNINKKAFRPKEEKLPKFLIIHQRLAKQA
jgi:hypothetical protein